MNLNRRIFIKKISFATAFLLGGGFKSLSENEVNLLQKKVKMRFAVASDAHYGQPNTLFDAMIEKITGQINLFHLNNPLDFCVINGDIVHDDKAFLPLSKKKIDVLEMPYFVTRGNHDKCTGEFWESVWNTPLNHHLVVKKSAILLGDTSNEQGDYTSPNLDWLKEQLDMNKKRKNIFLFLHIPQAKWSKHAIETPAFFELIKEYPNLRAVFHGHEHDLDGVQMVGNLPFLFDSHIGGNWGTPYKGFRVVELLNDGTLVTYLMDPTRKLNEMTYPF